jgi:hypothetical protein
VDLTFTARVLAYAVALASFAIGLMCLVQQWGGLIASIWLFLALADFGLWIISGLEFVLSDHKIEDGSLLSKILMGSLYFAAILFLLLLFVVLAPGVLQTK